MTTDEHATSQLQFIYELLRSLFEQNAQARKRSASSLPTPFVPPLPPDSQLSATDLLTWWFQPATTTFDPWDEFFEQFPSAPKSQAAKQPSVPPSASELDIPPELALRQPQTLNPWTDFRALFSEPEEELIDEHAEAAVECLYDFVHAIGRRDVDAAMQFVAQDYHVLEADNEIDRLALRHQIEALLDSLRGWEFNISLATIPEPVLHPNGILIYAEIQVDAHRADDDLRRCINLRRVAVLERQRNHVWLISALSPIAD